MEIDCSQLVNNLKNGNAQAAEEIYKLTSKKAFNTAYYILGSKYRQDVEDVVQESYLYAFMNISQLRDAEKFESWLRTIVINKAKDYLTKNNSKLFLTTEYDNANFWNEAKFTDTSFQEYQENTEKAQIIASIIDKLPDEQRICIVLYYFNEMSVAEIAEVLHVPQGTIKSRLYTARTEIKKQVEKLEGEGIKLYGFGIGTAIFLGLNTNAKMIEASEALGAAIICKIGNMEGIKRAGQVGENLAKQIAKGVGNGERGATFSLGAKIAAGTAAVVVVAGITTTIVLNNNKSDETPQQAIVVDAPEYSDEGAVAEEEGETTGTLKVVEGELEGLEVQLVKEDILAATGIDKEAVDNMYGGFITKDIMWISVFFNDNTHKKFLITVDGTIINAGDVEDVMTAAPSSREFRTNCPDFTYGSYNNYFAISYAKDLVDYNTFGLMDINGNMVINNEYAYIEVLSSTFAAAYKAVETEDENAPYLQRFKDMELDTGYIYTTGVRDIYNIKTGEKIEALSDMYITDSEWLYANDDIVILQRDTSGEGDYETFYYDKDGNIFDFASVYNVDEELDQIEDRYPATKEMNLAIRDDNGYYLANEAGEQVSDTYYYIERVNDYFIADGDEGMRYIIDAEGNVICEGAFSAWHPDKRSSVELFEYGICRVGVQDGDERKTSYMNTDGNLIVEPFTYSPEYSDGYLISIGGDSYDNITEILTPGGILKLTGNQRFFSVADNQGVFSTVEINDKDKKMILYDYALNPLLEISGTTESGEGVGVDISFNMDSTYAIVQSNDKKVALYKIVPKE